MAVEDKSRAYHDEKDALDGGADENKHTSTKNNGYSNLFQQFETRLPKHWNWNEDEVWVGGEIRGESHPYDGHGDSGLANI